MPEEVKEELENDSEEIVVEVEEEPSEASESQEPEEASAEPAEPESGEQQELEQYTEGVKKRINKLTAKMREAERREQAALEYAKSVQAQLNEASQKTQSLDASYVAEFENRVNTEEELLKQTLKRANDIGDTDAQFEANKRLAQLAGQRERLEYVKADQARRAQVPQQPQPVQQPQVPQQSQAPDPKAEAWAAKNEWFGVDEPMTLTALYMHKQLTEVEGFDPTSDEYYKEVDTRLRQEFPHKFSPTSTTKKKSGPQVAGASRSNNGRGKQQVKLTPSQVAISKKLGITEQQYAKQLLRMQQTS